MLIARFKKMAKLGKDTAMRRVTPLPVALSILVGAALWLGAGYCTAYASFEAKEATAGQPSAKQTDIHQAMQHLTWETTKVWIPCGAFAGLLTMAFFLRRPIPEYAKPAQQRRRSRPGAPRTQAELKTMYLAFVLGLGGGVALSWFYVPRIAIPDALVCRSEALRITLGTFLTLGTTLGIMPTCLWIMEKLAKRRRA